MKNLYNTIENNLKKGLNVVVKDLEGNDYCTIFNSKDSDGDYRMSDWCNSIEKAKQYIRSCSGYSKKYWDALNLEIVEVFRPEYEPFQVGDKVRILDSIKKTEDWESLEDKFEDMTGVIRKVFIERIGTYYSINGWCVGHEYLAPLVEEEDNVALEAIKLLEEKGYKIVKNKII